MKYNIFEIMILAAFVLYTINNMLCMILGTVFLVVGATYVIKHKDEYVYEFEYEEVEDVEPEISEIGEGNCNKYIA